MREADLIAQMESLLDVVEIPLGSNRTRVGVEYGWNGVSWCAESISIACNRLGFPLHEAAVARIEAHARAGDWGMGWTREVTVASAVCLDFGGRGNWSDMHTGLVTRRLNATQFRTIEGNHHDRCERVIRDMKFVRGFATFPFDGAVIVPPAPPQPTPQPINQQEDSNLVANLPTLQRGSNGQAVKNLQGLLKAANRPLDIDGDFGEQTETQLRQWQHDANVPGGADGVCGTNSWRWLLGLH